MALDATALGVRSALSQRSARTGWPVTVIIRTAGAHEREHSLKRAVQSAITQQGVNVHCCVVFNGNSWDDDLVAWTRMQHLTSCIELRGGGKQQATLLGRQLVKTPFFCYLDDDDELLPDALATRIAVLEDGAFDCVATNGYHHRDDVIEPLFPHTRPFVAGDFLEALVDTRNWLASGACMFRTATVKASYFADLPPHREWTLIAYRIAGGLRVKFVDIPTCRINSSPVSESKTDTYAEASLEAWEKIMRANRRADLTPAIRMQQAVAWRNLCSFYRSRRRFGHAWYAYVQALARGAGWSFVPYAALLLARTARPAGEIKRALQAVRFS